MDKKIFEVYLAKEDVPNNEAYAKLNLPASPWELWDAMDKVRLQTDDILYMEIEGYDAFEYLSPHLDGLDISLNELNDLAALLSALDEVQEIAFEGLFSIELQRKVNANGGVITLQDLRDLAVSAKTDCYHVVDAADDAALGRFYACLLYTSKLGTVVILAEPKSAAQIKNLAESLDLFDFAPGTHTPELPARTARSAGRSGSAVPRRSHSQWASCRR